MLAIMLCMDKLADEVIGATSCATLDDFTHKEILQFSTSLNAKFWVCEARFK